MPTYAVELTSTASLTMYVDVEVTDDMDEQDAKEKAIEEAIQDAPSDVCAHCGGYGSRNPRYSMDLGTWEVNEAVEPQRQV